MKTRLITGSLYILTLAGFFLLKIFVHDFFFDGLIWLFALIGTFEITRAYGERLTKAEKVLCFLFAFFAIPVCALFEEGIEGVIPCGYGFESVAVCFFVFAFFALSLLVVRHEETSLESVGGTFLCAVYPTLLLALLVLCNHFSATEETQIFALDGNLAVLLIFVISPFADSIAYVFGRFLRKFFPKKMSPVLSPNKTVIGGIGGLVGGLIGACILYFAYNGVCGSFDRMELMLPVYLGFGLVEAVATAFGDLVESAIKRKADIKDMGKLLPGHGGILDRIDGTIYATFVVYLAFLLLYAVL